MASSTRIVMARRPDGMPVAEDFREETVELDPLAAGEAQVKVLYLSLDPYMRGRMSDAPSYVPPMQVGDVMVGEVVGEVEADESGRFRPGQIVRGHGGWQSRFKAPAETLSPVELEGVPISTALGVLGMPGFTAYAALERIGRPKAGETIVIGSASGPVGAVAGQLARLKGLRTVGIAGGAEKCRYVEEELRFDVCLDRRQGDLAARLKEACPDGIDIYLELTGGEVSRAAFPLMNLFGRIPVVGMIAWYNSGYEAEGPDRLPGLMRQVLSRRLHIQGLLVYDANDLRPRFEREVAAHVAAGEVRFKEDVVKGLANAPEAFIGMLDGRNFGKLLVEL